MSPTFAFFIAFCLLSIAVSLLFGACCRRMGGEGEEA